MWGRRIFFIFLLGFTSLSHAVEFAPGISLQYFDYREEPLSIQVEQMSFWGQLEVSQSVIKETLEVSARIYGTIATIAQWPSEVTSPRFLGLDGRGSYSLSLTSEFVTVFHLGWYYWTMYVAEDPYGVEGLSSPFLELEFQFLSLFPRKLSLHFKAAPISQEAFSIDTRNRELTLILRYDLFSRPAPARNVDLVLQLSQTRNRSFISTTDNSLSLFSASLGIQSFL